MSNDKEMSFADKIAFAFGQSEKAKQAEEERKQEEEDRKEAERRKVQERKQAQESAVEYAINQQNACSKRMEGAVTEYCRKTYKGAMYRLAKEGRMPRVINYRERYNALKTMKDRDTVLMRLKGTIDLAENIINASQNLNPQGAYDDAAAYYCRQIGRICVIPIANHERPKVEAVEVKKPDVAPQPKSELSKMRELFKAEVGGIFDETLGEIPVERKVESEIAHKEKAEQNEYRKQLNQAKGEAKKKINSYLEQQAIEIEGVTLQTQDLPLWNGTIKVTYNAPIETMQALLKEVRISFDCFSQIVMNNGLFAAFAVERTFGACKGAPSFWWDLVEDDDYWGDLPTRDNFSDIPDMIEEDKGGDNIERSILRMQQLNKKRYWGMLDEDFMFHVEAFWYGFKKLMIFTNALVDIDSREFDRYCRTIRESLAKQAKDLGLKANNYQADEFCDTIRKLKK